VSDHRINLTLHSLDKTLEGELDPLIDALITHYQRALKTHDTPGVEAVIGAQRKAAPETALAYLELAAKFLPAAAARVRGSTPSCCSRTCSGPIGSACTCASTARSSAPRSTTIARSSGAAATVSPSRT
jgi:hypothetical protein